MKRIFLLTVFIFIVSMMLSAKVTYVKNDDGTPAAIITFKSDIYQANIIGSFCNWAKPGVPMVKNADGIWEYRLTIDAPMIKYKFFNPAISDDSAYLDDPDPLEKIANPFGSFDYLLRRSAALKAIGGGDAGGAAAVEDEEFNPVFGLWGQIYYNFQLFGDFGAKVVYDKNGNVAYNGPISAELNKDMSDWKSEAYKNYDSGDGAGKIKRQVIDGEVGFANAAGGWGPWRFYGENGTKDGSYSRLILGRDSFNVSTTLKFHGKVAKHFQVDVEINSQLFWINGNDRWVGAAGGDTKESREKFWKERMSNNVSNFISGLFGGVGREYVFPKQYYHNDAVGTESNPGASGAVGSTAFVGGDIGNGSMHVDQVQVCWTTNNFDIYVSPAGGKNFYSKDPMSLVSSTRIASMDYSQSSVQAFIHPAAVKGLNFNLATTYSAATKNYSGGGWRTGGYGSEVANLSEVGRYIAVTDIYYNILGLNKYTIGFIWNMSALGVPARATVEFQNKDYAGLYAFNNAVYQLGLWTDLNPVKGLNIKFEGVMELDTRFGDKVVANDANPNWYSEKASFKGYDPLAHMADYLSVGYSNSFLDVTAYQGAAGSRFKGNLAEYGSMFAGYVDLFSYDYSNGVDGHGDFANRKGTIGGGLKFGIKPIFSNPGLLKLTVGYDLKAIGLASLEFASAKYRLIQEPSLASSGLVSPQKLDMAKQWTMQNTWRIGLESNLKLSGNIAMYIRADAEFALDTYFGQALIGDLDHSIPIKVKDANTSMFTFKEFDLRVGLTGLSDVLKSFEVNYHLTLRNQSPYKYGSPVIDGRYDPYNPVNLENYFQTQKQYNDYNNQWAFKVMYHMIGAQFKFKHDITLNAAYLFRFSHGKVGSYNKYDSAVNMTGEAAEVPLIGNNKTLYYSVPDYYSWGLAFQLQYVIPVKILKTPTLFVNLNMGWDPSSSYDPGYAETANFNTSSTNFDTGTGTDWGGHIHSFQMVNLTLGLKWDF